MAGFPLKAFGRVALLSGASLCALTLAAHAKDLPATADGAAALTSVFKTYVGGDPAQSGLSVTPEGSDYLVSVDVAALLTPFLGPGAKIDAAKTTLKLFAQDDGSWRLERSDVPTIAWHAPMNKVPTDFAVAFTGFNSSTIYDPAIGGPRSGTFSSDKLSYAIHQPNADQSMDFINLKGTVAGKAGSDGAYSATGHETLDSLAFDIVAEPKASEPGAAAAPANPKPTRVTGKTSAVTVDVQLDGLKTQQLLDLRAFVVAHPKHADVAADAAAFKSLLTPIAASQPSGSETFAIDSMDFNTEQGKVTIGKSSGQIGLTAHGPASQFNERFAVSGLQLPAGVVPPMFHDLIPTSFDIGVKVTGFDLNAAAQEALTDVQLTADGSNLSKEDKDKVTAKLFGAGPLLIDIPPSKLNAPQLNVSFEGKIQYQQGGKPTGTLTVHVKDFDKTVAALKGLGPEAEQKYVPVLAMAKGLAKTDSDGSLTWVGEIGPDRVMKVNGLPLGKSPF